MKEDMVNGGFRPRRNYWSDMPSRLVATAIVVVLWVMFVNWWTGPGPHCYCRPDDQECVCRPEDKCLCPTHPPYEVRDQARSSTRLWLSLIGSVLYGGIFFLGWGCTKFNCEWE